MKSVSRYHKFLRVSAVVFTLMLLFDGGFITPITKQLSDNAVHYVANVGSGLYAGVPPNEINSLTAQIAERQRILDAREAALEQREIEARTFNETAEGDYSIYVLSLILFLLTSLILANYILDWRRYKVNQYAQQVA